MTFAHTNQSFKESRHTHGTTMDSHPASSAAIYNQHALILLGNILLCQFGWSLKRSMLSSG